MLRMMHLKGFIPICCLLLIFCTSSLAFCQTMNRDSASHKIDTVLVNDYHFKKPSVLLQFLGGSIGYAIPFWALGGKEYIRTGDSKIGSVFLGFIGAGVASAWVGNQDCDCQGSYSLSILGAFVGAIISGPIYGGALYNSNSTVLKYLALSIPPTVVSIFIYQLGLTDSDFDPPTKASSLIIAPSYYNMHGGLYLEYKF